MLFQEVAMENGIPCLYVVDSGGAFLPLQSEIFPDVKHGGRTFRNQAVMSGLGISQVAIVCGPCTAGGAYTPTMSDEAIIVNGIGHVFLAGPPLVKAATGEDVTHDELGGARLHTQVSGVADYFAADEKESFAQVRDIISGLNLTPPQNLDPAQNAPIFASTELDYFGGLDNITKADVKSILARTLDHSRFSEFKANFGTNLTCGFGQISSQIIGICANSGHLTSQDGQKGAHFLQLCDGRDIPVIYLQNNASTDEQPQTEAIKEVAKFAHCSANLAVPKIAINIGGLGGPSDLVAMCGPSFGPRFAFAWPRARLSKLNLHERPEEQPITDTNFPEDSAQYAASRCTIDNVILPRETRTVLAKSLQIVLHNHGLRGRVGRFRGQQQSSVIRI
jgi:3-methylcrotonyl-CoA carboxylase beta subunit